MSIDNLGQVRISSLLLCHPLYECDLFQKERDLELAARIGQSLLKQNQELTTRNGLLDEQLESAKEEVQPNEYALVQSHLNGDSFPAMN